MILISYFFFDDGKFAWANLSTFLASPPLENAEYIFYGVETDLQSTVAGAWPNCSNYICKSIPNQLFDFQGFKLSIEEFVKSDRFDFLFVINSTVAGPFIPSYVNAQWCTLFTDLFTNSNVGMVGSTISVLDGTRSEAIRFNEIYNVGWPVYPHIQSFFICISKKCACELLSTDFLKCVPQSFASRLDAISHYEINLSVRVLKMGYILRSLIPHTDACIKDEVLRLGSNLNTPHCDFGMPNGYNGRNLSPYEGVFMKTRRSENPHELLLTYNISSSKNIDVD